MQGRIESHTRAEGQVCEAAIEGTIQVGDLITQVSGIDTSPTTGFVSLLPDNKALPIRIQVRRGGDIRTMEDPEMAKDSCTCLTFLLRGRYM